MSLRKSLSETSAPRPEPKFQTLFAHFSNSSVVRDPALEGDGFIFGATGRFPAAARIAAFAVFDHFGRAFERADFAHAGDVTAVPFHAKLEVLVGIETLCVDTELGHW